MPVIKGCSTRGGNEDTRAQKKTSVHTRTQKTDIKRIQLRFLTKEKKMEKYLGTVTKKNKQKMLTKIIPQKEKKKIGILWSSN